MATINRVDGNQVQRPFVNAASVSVMLGISCLADLAAQKFFETFTETHPGTHTVAIVVGTSLFCLLGPRLHRISADRGAVYVGGIISMVATDVITSASHPILGFASGALLGGLAAERLARVFQN